MKSKIILSVFLTIGLLVGCSGNQNTKGNNDFNRAMIKMADDTVITVNVKKYIHDFQRELVIILTENGEKYCVANTDVTLYVEKPQEQ